MAMSFTTFLLFICISIAVNFEAFVVRAENNVETYIVHIDQEINDPHSFMARSLADEKPRIVHHYRHVFSGFAAKLSADEVKAMEGRAGFVWARRERVYEVDTTHTPNFLGLNQNAGFWRASNYGKGVIIGMLDTGITPGHPSFDDEGVPPPPAKWKGVCGFKSCNNKLIGARTFVRGTGTPVDYEGHGTHTSGTAAGNFVRGANILGSANGTAAGVAPLAHVATYKVCGSYGCAESDMLAGMDAAIADGVDVISMSVSAGPSPFHSDNIAVGAFRAMERGIFVSCAAGNSGPYHWTTSNAAPWILTVGASTVDRRLAATVVLGDGHKLSGESPFQPRNFSSADLEVVFPGGSAFYCAPGDLRNRTDIAGKIVLCAAGGPPAVSTAVKAQAVKSAGGAAMILMHQDYQGYTLLLGGDHVLPTSQINYADTLKIKSYLTRASNPRARIVFEGTRIGDPHAPFVASFSSRGPNTVSPGILKPDIVGPGSNILAAWPTSVEFDGPKFNMISGTSMSCPHLSGVAALLKSAHPDWSPAAIKSAIMTTADRLNRGGKPIEDERHVAADVFATGAGHVNPSRANHPGLIYDLQPQDYILYLCGLNYTHSQVSIIAQRRVDCSKLTPIPEPQLNYPSFSISFGSNSISSQSQTYTRTVTNVGESNSSYRVKIVSPRGVTLNVSPTKLIFTKVGQKLSYNVTFTQLPTAPRDDASQGLLNWISAHHSVVSPIAVRFGKFI